MDLGTAAAKLQSGAYQSGAGFVDDVRRVWANATGYFTPSDERHHAAALRLDVLFEVMHLTRALALCHRCVA